MQKRSTASCVPVPVSVFADRIVFQGTVFLGGNVRKPFLPSTRRSLRPLVAVPAGFIQRSQDAGGCGAHGLLLILKQRDQRLEHGRILPNAFHLQPYGVADRIGRIETIRSTCI